MTEERALPVKTEHTDEKTVSYVSIVAASEAYDNLLLSWRAKQRQFSWFCKKSEALPLVLMVVDSTSEASKNILI
jgi:hypothetical protein